LGILRPEEQVQGSKSLLAAIILKLAATGERDPIRLRTRAITEVTASEATIANNAAAIADPAGMGNGP
jgi:hypothetical protein